MKQIPTELHRILRARYISEAQTVVDSNKKRKEEEMGPLSIAAAQLAGETQPTTQTQPATQTQMVTQTEVPIRRTPVQPIQEPAPNPRIQELVRKLKREQRIAFSPVMNISMGVPPVPEKAKEVVAKATEKAMVNPQVREVGGLLKGAGKVGGHLAVGWIPYEKTKEATEPHLGELGSNVAAYASTVPGSAALSTASQALSQAKSAMPLYNRSLPLMARLPDVGSIKTSFGRNIRGGFSIPSLVASALIPPAIEGMYELSKIEGERRIKMLQDYEAAKAVQRAQAKQETGQEPEETLLDTFKDSLYKQMLMNPEGFLRP